MSMLPITITGLVIHGQKRGRLLGFPTANIQPDKITIEAIGPGVYTSLIKIGNKVFKSATSVGFVSTFSQNYPTIESYILDFNQDIYGESVTLHLFQKIREMQKFESVEKLIKQIQADVNKISDLDLDYNL